MKTISFRAATRATVLLMTGALFTFGQGNTGNINGQIQDPGGASVAGANVVLTNLSTSEARSTRSSGTGEYVFAQVAPSSYSIAVEAQGFKKLVRNNVLIALQQSARVDLTLELGQLSESVQVNDSVALIETATASNGQTIDSQMLTDLPNLGRNPYLMSKLSNNVVPVGDPRWNRFQDQIGSSAISIAGGPIRGNNYLIDGIPVTTSQNLAAIIPSLEATQEMKLQTGTYDATMGRTGGGVFNTIIKSGGNTFHGDLMGYIRNTDLAANNFFNNAAGLPRDITNFKTWGSSLTGPLLLPTRFTGRNKTFFAAAIESYVDKQPRGALYGLPNAQQRTGNFTGSGLTVYDYRTTHPCAGAECTIAGGRVLAAGTAVRTAFANNTIPDSLINPVARNLLTGTKYFPLPNNSSLVNPDQPNFTGSDTLGNRGDQYDFKLEQNFTEKLRMTGSFLYYKSFEPGGNPLGTFIGDSGAYLLYRHVDATAANAYYTVNPTTVATVRFGFNRFPNIYNHVSSGFDPKSVGFNYPVQQLAFPRISISNAGTGVGYSALRNQNYWSRNFSTSVSKFSGRHSLQMGFDYRSINAGGASYGAADGSFTFNGVFTQQTPSTTNSTGADWADFLLGAPSAGTIQTTSLLYFKAHYYGAYLQDDIRVNSKLTLNVGLRYEFETGIRERIGGVVVGFDQSATNPIASLLPANSGVTPRGSILFSGLNGANPETGNAPLAKWGPRIGVAWQLNPKTTLRGGWGMFYAPTFFGIDAETAPGFVPVTTYNSSNDGNGTPAGGLSNPFTNGVLQPTGNKLGAATGLGGTFSFVDQNRTAGLVQQFSFDVQRQLPWSVALQFGYVGSRSRNMLMASTGNAYLPINQVDPALYTRSGLTSSANNPFFGLPNVGGVLSGRTTTQAQLLRPFPQYDAISMNVNKGHARYDSVNTRIQKRMTNGLTLLGTVTFSKNFDNMFASGGAVSFNSGSPSAPQNSYNLEGEYSLAAADTPWRETLGWSYEMPFGKGKAFLHNNNVVNYLVGGWSVNGTAIFNTGFPLFITQTNSNSVVGAGAQRPNATGISPEVSGAANSKLASWFNKAAFSTAPQFTFGNLSRTIPYRGPGQANIDMSVFKTVTVREHYKGEFRVEALNVTNHPLFNNPNTNFSSAAFGRITAQGNLPRSLQLGLRFQF